MPALTLELGPTAYELDFDVRVTFSARGEVSGLRLYRMSWRHSRGIPGQPSYQPAHQERSDALPIPPWLMDDLETAAMDSDEAREAAEDQAEASRRPARDARMEAGL